MIDRSSRLPVVVHAGWSPNAMPKLYSSNVRGNSFEIRLVSRTRQLNNEYPTQFPQTEAYSEYVCMYLMIGKRQIAKKDHIGAKIDFRSKVRVNTRI